MEDTYIQKLTQDMLDWKYVSILDERKVNRKENNYQQIGWGKLHTKPLGCCKKIKQLIYYHRIIRLRSFTLHSRTQEFWRNHQITSRCQKRLGGKQLWKRIKYNQQSDLYSEWTREGRASDTNGILGNFKLKIVVRGDLQNNEMIGDTWSPTKSI